MEMFSDVEWKNWMQQHKNQSVTVVRNLFDAVLTETWISDSYGVRFGSTSSENICDDQTWKDSFIGSFLRTFLKEFAQKLV